MKSFTLLATVELLEIVSTVASRMNDFIGSQVCSKNNIISTKILNGLGT